MCHTKPALQISLPVPSMQQDGYDSDSVANSESESEAESDFDTESESLESLDEP